MFAMAAQMETLQDAVVEDVDRNRAKQRRIQGATDVAMSASTSQPSGQATPAIPLPMDILSTLQNINNAQISVLQPSTQFPEWFQQQLGTLSTMSGELTHVDNFLNAHQVAQPSTETGPSLISNLLGQVREGILRRNLLVKEKMDELTRHATNQTYLREASDAHRLELQSQIDWIMSEGKSMAMQMHNYVKSLAELKDENDQLRSVISTGGDQLNQAAQEASQARSELHAARSELAEFKRASASEIGDAASKLQTAQQRIDELQSNAERDARSIGESRERIAQLELDSSKLSNESPISTDNLERVINDRVVEATRQAVASIQLQAQKELETAGRKLREVEAERDRLKHDLATNTAVDADPTADIQAQFNKLMLDKLQELGDKIERTAPFPGEACPVTENVATTPGLGQPIEETVGASTPLATPRVLRFPNPKSSGASVGVGAKHPSPSAANDRKRSNTPEPFVDQRKHAVSSSSYDSSTFDAIKNALSVGPSKVQEYEDIVLPTPGPTSVTHFTWHRKLIEALLAASRHKDGREVEWINQVNKTKDPSTLVSTGEEATRFHQAEHKLLSALMNYKHLSPDTRALIELKKDQAYRENKMITGRQVLCMMYANFELDVNFNALDAVSQLEKLKYTSDELMEKFYIKWLTVKDRNVDVGVVDDKGLLGHLRRCLDQSDTLKVPLYLLDSLDERSGLPLPTPKVQIARLEKILQDAITRCKTRSGMMAFNKRAPCFEFLKNGKCRNGDACRFEHTKPKGKGKGNGQAGGKGKGKGSGKGVPPADGKGKGRQGNDAKNRRNDDRNGNNNRQNQSPKKTETNKGEQKTDDVNKDQNDTKKRRFKRRGRSGQYGNLKTEGTMLPFMISSAVRSANVEIEWVVDTGASVDAITRSVAEGAGYDLQNIARPFNVNTANGGQRIDTQAEVPIPALNKKTWAAAMPDSPCLLSVGKRCLEYGYEFHWPKYSPPYLVSPEGNVIKLEVQSNVPILRSKVPVFSPLDQNKQDTSSNIASSIRAAEKAFICPNSPATVCDKMTQVSEELLDSKVELPNIPTVDEDAGGASPPVGNPSAKKEELETPSKVSELDAYMSKHVLTHLPADPKRCRACKIGKARDVRHFANRSKRDISKYGDVITCDHLDFRETGCCDANEVPATKALVIKDLFSGFTDCIPMRRINTENTKIALQQFLGPDPKIGRVYSDNAPQLRAAIRSMGLAWESSQPGVPVTNSRIERQNQLILDGTRAALAQAGLPMSFWSLAARTFCFNLNASEDKTGESPWKKRFGCETEAKLIPFGAFVDFKLAGTADPPKLASKLQPGVFMGYRVHDGYKWNGEYKAIELADFASLPLHYNTSHLTFASCQIHVVQRLERCPVSFPLSKYYDMHNNTLEGIAQLFDDLSLAMEQPEEFEAVEEQKPDPARETSEVKAVETSETVIGDVDPAAAKYKCVPKNERDEGYVKPRVRWNKLRPQASLFEKPLPEVNLHDMDTDYLTSIVEAGSDEGLNSFLEEAAELQPPTVHREKNSVLLLRYSCIARPVKGKEVNSNPAARAALDLEWSKLRAKKVWDETTVREKHEVIADARRSRMTVHFGMLNGLCFEKNAELPEGDPQRKFKGRVVFLGNCVRDEHWAQAIFQDLGSSPATMEASKAIDAFGCFPGNLIQQADAEQAYVQAELKGPPLWISLPKYQWPKNWHSFSNPVCLLKKALYGHPDSGTFWEQHCNEQLFQCGFKQVPNWNSCFHHPVMNVFLLVYVDDFKLAGPAAVLPACWKLLGKRIQLDLPKELDHYLGCDHVLSRHGNYAVMEYSMQQQLSASLIVYQEECNKLGVKINTKRKASTPFCIECGSDSPSAQPVPVDIKVNCPHCKKEFRTDKRSRAVTKEEPIEYGKLARTALKVLMKLMYSARLVRYDLLRPVGVLTRLITRWTPQCDEKLDKLMAYVRATLDLKLYGYIGDRPETLQLDLYSDADFAGLPSQHSTTGGHLALVGPRSRFPLSATSKKQSSVSTSTAEAELTALFHMVRSVAIPHADLWMLLVKRTVVINIFEDNQTVIHIVRTGKNQTMRHFERTHRVAVAWLHEIYQDHTYMALQFAKSEHMIADVYTKQFADVHKFARLRTRIGLSTSYESIINETGDLIADRDWKGNTRDTDPLIEPKELQETNVYVRELHNTSGATCNNGTSNTEALLLESGCDSKSPHLVSLTHFESAGFMPLSSQSSCLGLAESAVDIDLTHGFTTFPPVRVVCS